MKRIVFALMFLLSAMAGMSQKGVYTVDKFCKNEVKTDGLMPEEFIPLYNICIRHIEPQNVVIEEKSIRFELADKGVIKLECDVKQEGNRWIYENLLRIDQIDKGKYVVRLKNDSPLMYLSKKE